MDDLIMSLPMKIVILNILWGQGQGVIFPTHFHDSCANPFLILKNHPSYLPKCRHRRHHPGPPSSRLPGGLEGRRTVGGSCLLGLKTGAIAWCEVGSSTKSFTLRFNAARFTATRTTRSSQGDPDGSYRLVMLTNVD